MDCLEGVVERITFHNPDNGYTVLRLNASGQSAPVTVVGNLPPITPGERLRLSGYWTTHVDYGRQFKAEQCEPLLPATVESIRRYLGSGLIKGIGPRTAEKIVQAFGPATLEVIDTQPQRLLEVPDIGRRRYEMIMRAWEEQKAIKDIMVFLQGHGLSAALSVKIYRYYGPEALRVVRSEPYRLARDIWGIGFKTADKIARAVGLAADAPARMEAGILYTLNELAGAGHVCAPLSEVITAAAKLLEAETTLLAAAAERLEAAGYLQRDHLPDYPEPLLYLTPFYQAENNVAARVLNLSRSADVFGSPQSFLTDFASADWQTLFSSAELSEGTLSEEQRQAIRCALTEKVCVLTGGPGVGKTTTLQALIRLLELKHHPYALAAPTGRAARRLAEATGRPAQTIHRLLGFSPTTGFAFDDHHRLPAHMVIVDETSMLDLILFNDLLKAIAPQAHLLLVGDADQLPSVGAGDVLRSLLHSGRVATARLTHVFRQAAESSIIANAHRINRGEMPTFSPEGPDFFLFPVATPEEAARWVVDIVQNRIPRRFGLRPLDDVQVLAPMYRGTAGVHNLNVCLQAALNPPADSKAEKQIGGRLFRVGDRVMQLRNNYLKEVFNGDIGRVVELEAEAQTLTVNFDGRLVVYDWVELDELQHAFAASVHKAQGGEFPAVVIVLLPQHYLLLQRNLVYTAVTRARQLCVLVGSPRALAMAIKNNTVSQRWSGLEARLRMAFRVAVAV